MNLNYQVALDTIQSTGDSCYPRLRTVAELGIHGGLSHQQITADIQQAMTFGKRRLSAERILKVIEDAENEVGPAQTPNASDNRPEIFTTSFGELSHIMAAGSPGEENLRESSPVKLPDNPEADAAFLLRHFYRPEDHLFIGNRFDKRVLQAQEWLKHIERGTAGLPYIIPNPLTGQEHAIKKGKKSYRCDAAVKEFRFALAEYDDMDRENQFRFWSGWMRTPGCPRVACLIDSGNKSIHAWLQVDISDYKTWGREIKGGLFKLGLIPLGLDPTTHNPARLSRLPGHFRQDPGQWQRLLWLNTPQQAPAPTSICAAGVTDAVLASESSGSPRGLGEECQPILDTPLRYMSGQVKYP